MTRPITTIATRPRAPHATRTPRAIAPGAGARRPRPRRWGRRPRTGRRRARTAAAPTPPPSSTSAADDDRERDAAGARRAARRSTRPERMPTSARCPSEYASISEGEAHPVLDVALVDEAVDEGGGQPAGDRVQHVGREALPEAAEGRLEQRPDGVQRAPGRPEGQRALVGPLRPHPATGAGAPARNRRSSPSTSTPDGRALGDLAGDDAHGEGILQQALHDASQRPRAVHRVVALAGQQVACRVAHLERDLALGHARAAGARTCRSTMARICSA